MNTMAPNRIDIQKLESYWICYQDYKKELSKASKDEMKSVYYKNLQTLVKAIEQLYEMFDEELRTIINMRYWDKSTACHEWINVADELYMSVQRVLRKRNYIINCLANRIGYIPM